MSPPVPCGAAPEPTGEVLLACVSGCGADDSGDADVRPVSAAVSAEGVPGRVVSGAGAVLFDGVLRGVAARSAGSSNNDDGALLDGVGGSEAAGS